jgi:hypothetical protein
MTYCRSLPPLPAGRIILVIFLVIIPAVLLVINQIFIVLYTRNPLVFASLDLKSLLLLSSVLVYFALKISNSRKWKKSWDYLKQYPEEAILGSSLSVQTTQHESGQFEYSLQDCALHVPNKHINIPKSG